ncbi:MAG TPA: DUF2335 domain-containing protein [Steroidobacteraceae bacterium]|nr:DUF2335 domain-containing protein [Steroidobacteraceae bacterium]
MSNETPPTQPNRLERQQAVLFQAQRSGPLPAPAELEHYDRIVPGMAERILRLTEQERAHREEQERNALAANIANAGRGQWLGGITILAAIVGAVVIVALHGPWQAAVALVGVPLLGAVQALIRGRDANQ